MPEVFVVSVGEDRQFEVGEPNLEATVSSSTEQTVTDAATNYTDQVSPETATVPISPSLSSVEAGDMITVTVTIPASAISPLGSTWMGADFQVDGSASMRREGYQ